MPYSLTAAVVAKSAGDIILDTGVICFKIEGMVTILSTLLVAFNVNILIVGEWERAREITPLINLIC